MRNLKRLIVFAVVGGIVFGLLHHTDHVIRGNHIGWPFSPYVTPFTLSLLVYPFFVFGLYLAKHDRLPRLYWPIFSVVVLALVVTVHFLPAPNTESFDEIYGPYAHAQEYLAHGPAQRNLTFLGQPVQGNITLLGRILLPSATPLWGWLAIADLYLLVGSLLLLFIASTLFLVKQKTVKVE